MRERGDISASTYQIELLIYWREKEDEEKEGEERREKRRLLGRAPIFLEKLTQINGNGNFSPKNRIATRGNQKGERERFLV